MATKTRVNVRAWSETTPAGTQYYIDGQRVLGLGGYIPLAQLADFTRGDIIVGGPTQWQDLALGEIGEFVGTDGTDVEWRGANPNNGFVNRTDSTLAMSGSDLRIAPAVTEFVIYSAGKRFTKTTNQDAAIASDLTQHYVYFDSAGAIQVSTTVWDITSDNVPAAIVYKDGATYAIQDERHGYRRNRDWHAWAHHTIGTRYESGLAGTFTDTTFSIAQGKIDDEDIEIDTGATKTACRLWYRNAAATAMRFESNVTTPYKITAGALQYDTGSGLGAVSANRYICSYVYATNDIDYPIYIVVGQAQYTNLANARNDPLPATPGQVTREWKLLYRVIYQQTGATADYIEAADFREVSTGPGSSYTPASHTALTDRDAASSHPASAIAEMVTLGRLMQGNGTTGALEASTVVKSGAGVLTLSAGGDYALTVSGDAELDQDVATTSDVQFTTLHVVAPGGFSIADTAGGQRLAIAAGTNLSTDRTLTLTTGDSNRTITLSGNPTLSDWFDQSVKAAATPTFANIVITNGGYTGITGGARIVFDSTNGRIYNILGDAAGGDEFQIQDSTTARVIALDSDGNGYYAGNISVVAGAALAPTAGRNYVTVQGTTGAGIYEIATSQADADAVLIGGIIAVDVNSAAADTRAASIGFYQDGATAANRGGEIRFNTKADNVSGLNQRATILENGNFGIGVTAPSTRLDIADGALKMAEMTAPSAPAANGVVIYAVDNGAGKTQLMALFATGAAQQIAIQP